MLTTMTNNTMLRRKNGIVDVRREEISRRRPMDIGYDNRAVFLRDRVALMPESV